MDTHERLVDTFGEDHPDTQRALTLVMEMAPEELKMEMRKMMREMGLMPEADGYLDDGSPVFKLENVAARLGVPQVEAEETMHEMHADREALGIPNKGIVIVATLIHWKQ
jgi:hypothetical protein